MLRAEDLLEHAASVVTRRRREYGEPIDLFEHVAKRWSLVLGVRVTPAQAMLCLVDLKVARLTHDPRHRDSLVDLIGYSVILHELVRDVSAAKTPAELAEPAEHERSPGIGAAKALLKSAEVTKSGG